MKIFHKTYQLMVSIVHKNVSPLGQLGFERSNSLIFGLGLLFVLQLMGRLVWKMWHWKWKILQVSFYNSETLMLYNKLYFKCYCPSSLLFILSLPSYPVIVKYFCLIKSIWSWIICFKNKLQDLFLVTSPIYCRDVFLIYVYMSLPTCK